MFVSSLPKMDSLVNFIEDGEYTNDYQLPSQ